MGGIIVHVSGAPAAFSTQTALGLLVIGMIAVGVPRGGPAGSTSGGVSANRGAGTTRASDGGVASEGGDGGVDGGASCLPAWMWSLVRVAPVGFSFSFVRSSRSFLIPLKADALGLSASAVGYVTSISFAFDAFFFPAAGTPRRARAEGMGSASRGIGRHASCRRAPAE